MKLAISACASGLDAQVDRRFGRAPWFVFYDTDAGSAEFVKNEGCEGLQGVGVTTAQMVVDRGAEVVLTGDVGPKARQVLDAAELKVVLDTGGNVGAAVDAFLAGKTTEAPAAGGVPFVGGGGGGGGGGRGMGGGGGRCGGGGGRGMGGGGRGMGGGGGRGMGGGGGGGGGRGGGSGSGGGRGGGGRR